MAHGGGLAADLFTMDVDIDGWTLVLPLPFRALLLIGVGVIGWSYPALECGERSLSCRDAPLR